MPLIDLTASNPTTCGFDYPLDLLEGLADRRALRYEPQPLGLDECARGGRRRLREAVACCVAGSGRPHGKQQRQLLAAVQAAVRSWRFGARAGSKLPAVRAPRATGRRHRAPVPARVPRPLDAGRARARGHSGCAHTCRAGREPEQPHRLDPHARRDPRTARVLCIARSGARGRRSVLRLSPDAWRGRVAERAGRGAGACHLARRSVEIGGPSTAQTRVDGNGRTGQPRAPSPAAPRDHRGHIPVGGDPGPGRRVTLARARGAGAAADRGSCLAELQRAAQSGGALSRLPRPAGRRRLVGRCAEPRHHA